jgi:hypothetical protein
MRKLVTQSVMAVLSCADPILFGEVIDSDGNVVHGFTLEAHKRKRRR